MITIEMTFFSITSQKEWNEKDAAIIQILRGSISEKEEEKISEYRLAGWLAGSPNIGWLAGWQSEYPS